MTTKATLADKRSVHTDALHTLGTIIGDGEKRDAIHIAVEPCIAGEHLHRGDHAGRREDGTFGHTGKPLGIVDPFLNVTVVKPGERFWLLIYPREITSLRHVWSHPEFPDAEVASFAEESGENFENHTDDVVVARAAYAGRTTDNKAESEAWLRNFLDNGDTPGYDLVMKAITGEPTSEDDYYSVRNEGEYIMSYGRDAHGDIPDEFWDHAEIVTGMKFPRETRASHFSCSC
jgi:hypothetical protein